jgi:ABC-type uncharacterized transport system substrate-binding protein
MYGFMSTISRFTVCFVAWMALGAGLAQAHPHLRMAYQIQPLLANGALRGFHISWQMDTPSSLQVRANIDLNQNGVLDPDELQAFADSNSPLMKPYNYFLTIEDGKSAAPLPFDVFNFSARDGGRGFQGGIFLEFDVQLSHPIKHNQAQLQMQDPTWYIGFMPRMGQVLAADSECSSDFTREKRQTPTQGEQEVQRIVVQCTAGSVARPAAQISPIHGPINGDHS